MDKYQEIFEKNKKWVEAKVLDNQDYFSSMSLGQNPDILYIGCSDSRVPANTITGLDMGDIFVHRNIANIVSNTDMNVLSVIQYAVEVLQVKYIVVCGHYGCGGVRAAMLSKSYGLLDNWLRNVRDVYRLHSDYLNSIEDENLRYDRLVELNVIEQCINIIKTSYLQKSYIANKYPTVHGWVYDLNTGFLKDLDINFKEILKKVQEIYNLE
jgi:carbonic anhydrase